MSAINIDAIYDGDNEATGDAIRLLAQAVGTKQGILPVLTDKIILPTFSNAGLNIETEQGRLIATLGGVVNGPSGPIGVGNAFNVDSDFLARLKLGPVIDIADTYSNATFQFGSEGNAAQDGGANHILYRAAPTSSKAINGIYATVPPTTFPRQRSQVVVIWNDSDYTIPFATTAGSGATAYQAIIGKPFAIGPQGAAIFVMEDQYAWPSATGGWRPIAIFRPGWVPYTPVWVSDGTQPTMGSSTIAGEWMRDGDITHFRASLTLGAGFSFGTGTVGLTLPSTPAAGYINHWLTRMLDATAGHYAGLALNVTLNSQPAAGLLTIGAPSAAVSSTAPYTFAVPDTLNVQGWYRE
jgi:hypothetical protein